MSDEAHRAPDLLPRAVHLWRIPLVATSAALQAYDSLLAPDERGRAARFHFEVHRRRFMIGRARLRILLASYLKTTPAALTFSYTDHGKPYLSGQPLSFNLSHSEDAAALGITSNRNIGVDIEKIRHDITEGIAERYFASAEVRALRSLPPTQQPGAFFRCWTRKEAYIKARGGGLSIPLADFEVPLDATGNLSLVHYRDPGEGARWSLQDVPMTGDYIAAVVVEGRDLSFEYFDWKDLE